MNTVPFNPPVTVNEHWKNILSDLGVTLGTKGAPIEMNAILNLLNQGLNGQAAAIYGNASDGVLNFISSGSATVAGATLSSGTYTMTRDIYMADGSVIASGSTIKTSGWRLFCNGTLTNNGIIDSSGNASVANAAGGALAYSSATISNTTVGAAGAAGSTTTGSAGSSSATNGLGGAGGAGGSNVSGPNAGAAGGTVTAPLASVQNLNSLFNALAVRVIGTTALALCQGGAGGGGGGGDGTNLSGGGGGGGGIVVVATHILAGTGTISANGGVGGAANATGTPSGGGGGGGGCIILVSASVSPTAPTITAGVTTVGGNTLTVAGGAAGAAGAGGGVPGNAGAAGTMILMSA